MPAIFFITFTLIFSLIAWKNLRLAIQIMIVLLPTYLIRFRVGPLPTTLLEISFGIVFVFWILKYFRSDWPRIRTFFQINKYFTGFFILFFTSSVISIFISDMWWFSFGQWRAYVLEPMVLFIVLIGRRDEISTNDLIWPLALSTVSIAAFGIVQKFTGWGLPTEEWRNLATRRITSFFTSPNAIGLYLSPILFLVMSKLFFTRNTELSSGSSEMPKQVRRHQWIYVGILTLSLIAIFFTKSLGAWVALFVGLLLFLFLVKRKLLAGVLVLFTILPLLFQPVQNFVLSKGKSTDNRLQLWTYSAEFLTTSPKNFIFGTGIRQFFRKVQKPHYNTEELERLIYPHNVFLNFWTEIGIFGMIGFIGMLYYLFKGSIAVYKKEVFLGAGFLAMLTAILVHGMIDVPYFKNDLSMLFWVFSALIFYPKTSEV